MIFNTERPMTTADHRGPMPGPDRGTGGYYADDANARQAWDYALEPAQCLPIEDDEMPA